MAKPPTKRTASPEASKQTKKQIALGRKEARQNRIILILVIALIAAILLIMAFGIISELVLKPSSAVATVNGVKIRADDYQNLVTYNRYNYYNNIANMQSSLEELKQTEEAEDEANSFLIYFYEQQISQLQTALTLAPEQSLDEMIDAELVREKAEELQIEVMDQEVDQAIDDDFRAAFAQQETITDTAELPTATPVPQKQVDQLYESVLSAMHLSEDSFRTIVERALTRDKVQEALAAEVPTTGLVVDLELIKAEAQQAVIVAKGRIENGEDFAIVAQEVSTDTLTAEGGGAVGWVTPGQLSTRYGAELDEYIFTLEVGELGMVESDNMFYLVRVVNRNENGPLPEEVLTERQNNALTDWLEERKASPDIKIERLLKPEQIPPDPFAAYMG